MTQVCKSQQLERTAFLGGSATPHSHTHTTPNLSAPKRTCRVVAHSTSCLVLGRHEAQEVKQQCNYTNK